MTYQMSINFCGMFYFKKVIQKFMKYCVHLQTARQYPIPDDVITANKHTAITLKGIL